MLPKDPVILLSFINTRLRDMYGSLDALCDDIGADKGEICDKLKTINYTYDPERNQFT